MTVARRWLLVIQDGEAVSLSPQPHESFEAVAAFLAQVFAALGWEKAPWRKVNAGLAVMRWKEAPERTVLLYRFQVPVPARNGGAKQARVKAEA